MDRKAFIRLASAGVLCTGSLGVIPGCTIYRYVDAVRSGNQLKVLKSNVGDDPFILIRHPGGKSPIYLRRYSEGSYLALLLECTHKKCTVNPAGKQFACPCHGSKYDPEGKVLEGPARQDLHTYPVTTDSDSIYIQLQKI